MENIWEDNSIRNNEKRLEGEEKDISVIIISIRNDEKRFT